MILGTLEFMWGSPWWVIPLAMLVGLGYAWAMHGRRPLPDIHRFWRLLLWGLRTLAVTLMVLLCFEPQWLTMERHVDPPLVVVALDQSRSMNRTGQRSEEILSFGQEIRQKLGKDYLVEILGFGEEVIPYPSIQSTSNDRQPAFEFQDQATSPDGLRAWVDEQMGQNPVSAWVLVSDGQFNQGADPLYLLDKDKAPIYTLTCGKPSANQPYWSMGSPNAPKRVPAESSFEIATTIQGLLKGYTGLRLELLEQGLDNATLDKKEFTLADQAKVNPGLSQFSSTIRLKASVGKPGIYAFKIKGVLEGVSSLSGVEPIPNNIEERLVYVEAVETLRRIKILALAPHPDLGVLRQTLEETMNYRVELSYGLQGLKQAANDALADLYILHQWPSVDAEANSNALLEQIYRQGKPLWYLGGARSQWSSWPGNPLNQNPSISSNTVSPALNKSWNAFAISAQDEQMLRRLPPLTVWVSGPSNSPQNQTLLYRQIGQINSERPLWTIDYQSNPSKAYLWGEGLWRWRLASKNSVEPSKISSENLTLAIHQRLILQTVSLLLSGRESDLFEAKPVKAVFNETENVFFEGSSRNASGEFENSAPLELQISSENKVLYEGAMTPSGMGYSLDASRWAPGIYRYTATLTRNGIAAVRKGTFAVGHYDLESGSGLANQTLMDQLSALHGGLARTLFSGSSASKNQGNSSTDGPASSANDTRSSLTLAVVVDDFVKHIRENQDIKPSSYQVSQLTEWLSWPLLWIILWSLLGVEWLLYRALGGK